MNARDERSVSELYYVNRFLPSSIARIFGVSHVTILKIVKKIPDTTMVIDSNCLLCSLEGNTFYIDGNTNNKNPQNVITLCEPDRRRIRALQLRKRKGSVISQFEPDPL